MDHHGSRSAVNVSEYSSSPVDARVLVSATDEFLPPPGYRE